MEWLTALKGLIKAKLSLHLSNNPNTRKTVIKDSQNVNIININQQLTPEVIEQLKSVLLPVFESKEVLFLQDDSKKLLNEISEAESSQETQLTLSFFKDKVPSLDFRLLRTGLYLQYLISRGASERDKASRIKTDIIARYGQRGKNIVNLASAGYFLSFIKPLYEGLAEQPEFSAEIFSQEYERIVTELPRTIFVHSGQSEEEIVKLVNEKAALNLQYSVGEDIIALHGYAENATAIERVIPPLEATFKRVEIETRYSGELKISIAKVYYKDRID